MSRLHIHIGTHKTGSTAIQHALRDHPVELKNEGIIYLPKLAVLKKLETIVEADGVLIENARTQLADLMKRGGDDLHILSFEGFSGNVTKGYTNSDIIAGCLSKITDGVQVSIIVYLRRQDLFLESLYTQMIQEGKAYSFSDFIANYKSDAFDWEALLESYASRFGKEHIIARIYDKSSLPGNDSLLKDFGLVIGSQFLQEFESKENPNQGYSREALDFAKSQNEVLTPIQARSLRKKLQEYHPRQLFESFSFFDSESRKKLLDGYHSSNSNVAKKYFETRDEGLFPESSDNDPKPTPASELKPFPEILDEVLNEQPKDGSIKSIIKKILGR